MLAQIKAYANLILLILFIALAIAGAVFFSMWRTESVKNKQLKETVDQLTTDFNGYKQSLEDAKTALNDLRLDLSAIDGRTSVIEGKINKIPKPTPNGANVKEIQDNANQVSTQVFGRLRWNTY